MAVSPLQRSVVSFFAAVGLVACNDAVREQGGCESDTDCLGARICVESLCVDPALDADFDTGFDDTDGLDGAVDAPLSELPEPPLPQRCLEALPERVDFGALDVGEATARRVTLRNCGVLPLELASVEVNDIDDVFALVSVPATPLLLDAGATADVVVRAVLAQPGGFGASLEAAYNDEQLLAVELVAEGTTGQTTGQCLRFVPASLDLGVAAAGELRTAGVRLEACGDEPVVGLTRSADSTPTLVLDGLPDQINVGETVEVQLQWQVGDAPGAFRGAVALEADGVPLARLSVSGAVTDEEAGCLIAEPATVDLPPTNGGERSVAEVVLTNCGETPLELGAARIDNPEFSVSYAVGELAPGESRNALISFIPAQIGTRAGVWRVPTATGLEYGPWVAFGLGLPSVAAPLRGPAIELRPASSDLGVWPIGSTVPTAFQVCNAGDETLVLDGATAEGDAAVVDADWTTASVEPGDCLVAAAELAVVDPPSAQGRVRVRSNARNASVAVFNASATATSALPEDFCLRAVTERVSLSAQVGSPIEGVLEFENCGPAPLTVRSVAAEAISGATAPILEVGAEPAPGALVGPGERIRVRFGALSESAQTAIWRVSAVTAEGALASSVVAATFTNTPVACFEPVEPVVDFGTVGLNTESRREVRYVNCGDATITLGSARITNSVGSGFSVARDIVGARVDPGDEVVIAVALLAATVGDISATLRVGVPAGTTTAPVALRAVVSNDPQPGACIRVEPTSIDLGAVELGLSSFTPVTMVNCGTSDIVFESQALIDGSRGWVAPRLFEDDGPFVLAAGDGIEFVVEFNAVVPGVAVDALLFGTRSPDLPEVRISLRAVVGGDDPCAPPVVGVATDPGGPFESGIAVRPNTELYFDVAFSEADARGEWTVLDAPRGATRVVSPSAVPSADGRVPSYRASLEGTHVFGFRWESSSGCAGQEAVYVDVRARSGVGEGLRVVATWRTPGDPDELVDPGSDIDLHLARRVSGRVNWNSPNDCNYANPSPTWSPVATSNPRLLRDEVSGLGPEIIVLEEPAETVYYVGIYYFSDSGFGPADVTLRVFFDGLQIGSATRRLSGTGQFWLGAEITNLGETVTFLPGGNTAGFPVGVP